MSIVEHSCMSEQFVSSCEDLFLSTTPKETFDEIEKYIILNERQRQIDELNYKIVQKDIIIHGLLKKNIELQNKVEEYKLGYDVWKYLIND